MAGYQCLMPMASLVFIRTQHPCGTLQSRLGYRIQGRRRHQTHLFCGRNEGFALGIATARIREIKDRMCPPSLRDYRRRHRLIRCGDKVFRVVRHHNEIDSCRRIEGLNLTKFFHRKNLVVSERLNQHKTCGLLNHGNRAMVATSVLGASTRVPWQYRFCTVAVLRC